MADNKPEKTDEEKFRLKRERAERRRTKKYETRAAERGIAVDVLLQEAEDRKVEEERKNAALPKNRKRAREEMMEKAKSTVYIGNLVYRAGEAEIRRLFAPLKLGDNAIVDITLPVDKETQKFYGVAFVQFDTPENAEKACTRNNFKLLGRPITVELKSAKHKKQKLVENQNPSSAAPSSSGAATSSDQSEATAVRNEDSANNGEDRPENDGSTVFVAAIADAATDEEIMMYFSKSGRVLSFRRIYDKVTKDFTGAAFVQFDNTTAAQRSLAFNRKLFHGRPLRVEMAKQKTMK